MLLVELTQLGGTIIICFATLSERQSRRESYSTIFHDSFPAALRASLFSLNSAFSFPFANTAMMVPIIVKSPIAHRADTFTDVEVVVIFFYWHAVYECSVSRYNRVPLNVSRAPPRYIRGFHVFQLRSLRKVKKGWSYKYVSQGGLIDACGCSPIPIFSCVTTPGNKTVLHLSKTFPYVMAHALRLSYSCASRHEFVDSEIFMVPRRHSVGGRNVGHV